MLFDKTMNTLDNINESQKPEQKSVTEYIHMIYMIFYKKQHLSMTIKIKTSYVGRG